MLMKEILRSEYSVRTAALTPEYRAAADEGIFRQIVSSALYHSSDTIFCFIGIKNEIDTLPFIKKLLADGKRLCAPRTLGGGVMEARRITSNADMEQVNSGLKLTEPKTSCPLVTPEEIDLIIAPCLSADPCGHRLGYGGGYYDRYLKQIRKEAVIIAVCREELLAATLPSGENDVNAHYIATESGMRRSLPPQSKSLSFRA
jgi:5-formyltetrahydrofolate cyclo-ligase